VFALVVEIYEEKINTYFSIKIITLVSVIRYSGA
jgi:hypothetical protein